MTRDEANGWAQTAEFEGDHRLAGILRSLEWAIDEEHLLLQIECEGELYDLLVLERGVGL